MDMIEKIMTCPSLCCSASCEALSPCIYCLCPLPADRVQRKGGGSCIYINKRLNYEKLPGMINRKDLELMCIILNGDGLHSQRKICVALAYRPPGGESNVAVTSIGDFIQQLNDTYKYKTVLLGDLNWDCLNDNENISELCNTFGLAQVLDSPTRITHNRKTLLDVILIDMKNLAHCGLHFHNEL